MSIIERITVFLLIILSIFLFFHAAHSVYKVGMHFIHQQEIVLDSFL